MKIFKDYVERQDRANFINKRIEKASKEKRENSFFYKQYFSINQVLLNSKLLYFFFNFLFIFFMILIFRNIEGIQDVYNTELIKQNIINESAEATVTSLFFSGGLFLLVIDRFVIRHLGMFKEVILDREKNQAFFYKLLPIFAVSIILSSFSPGIVMLFVFIFFTFVFGCSLVLFGIKAFQITYQKFFLNRFNQDDLFRAKQDKEENDSQLVNLKKYILEDPELIKEMIYSKKENRLSLEEISAYDSLIKEYYELNVDSIGIEDVILNIDEMNENTLKNY